MGGELTTAGRYIHLNISVCYLTSMKNEIPNTKTM